MLCRLYECGRKEDYRQNVRFLFDLLSILLSQPFRDPGIKRTICQGCSDILIPGSTTTVRVKSQSQLHPGYEFSLLIFIDCRILVPWSCHDLYVYWLWYISSYSSTSARSCSCQSISSTNRSSHFRIQSACTESSSLASSYIRVRSSSAM